MKTIHKALIAIGFSALCSVAPAAILTVNTVDNTDFSTGKTNMVTALRLLKDGDTVQFAIPGAGVHTINTPPDGYPLITANNITIDGFSQQQTGSIASPNTAGLHETNNAQIMICLSSVNGNALSMYSAVTNFAGIDYPNLGFGDSEQAVLGFFRATNTWVKGLAFLATPQTATTQSPNPGDNDCKTICYAVDAPDVSNLGCQGFHISGCWFGVDPTTRKVAFLQDGVTVATPAICVATYGTGQNSGTSSNQYSSGTIGVAANSPDPRAEFNVFVTGYGFDSQGGPFRISGNFWNILPDGTTLADISALNDGQQEGDAYVEFGSGHNILIGTDGDGINDAYEGNLFGAYTNGGLCIYYYGSQAGTVIAGNTFGMDIHGASFGVGQSTRLVHHFSNTSFVRFGSDFNGVSDGLEGNAVVDCELFDVDSGSTTNAHWISVRGNSLVNTVTPSGSIPPIGDGQASSDGLDIYANFIDVNSGNGSLEIIPLIDTATTKNFLIGACGKPVGPPYTNLVIDLYEADTTANALPQGKKWLTSFVDNSSSDLDTNIASFKFALPSGLVTSGKQITVSVTYSSDTSPQLSVVGRVGSQTTVSVLNGTNSVFGILQSGTVGGPYTFIAAQNGTSATFTDNGNSSFYKATAPSSTGPTTPFSAVFSIP